MSSSIVENRKVITNRTGPCSFLICKEEGPILVQDDVWLCPAHYDLMLFIRWLEQMHLIGPTAGP